MNPRRTAISRRVNPASAAGPWAPLGIGLHSGLARVGLVGTPQGVMDFTALGDTVNTTARLASVAAAGEIVISDASAMSAGLLPEDGAERCELRLRGRKESVRVRVYAASPTLAEARHLARPDDDRV